MTNTSQPLVIHVGDSVVEVDNENKLLKIKSRNPLSRDEVGVVTMTAFSYMAKEGFFDHLLNNYSEDD